jgi:ATP-binding protein involved in chromosome partitioning
MVSKALNQMILMQIVRFSCWLICLQELEIFSSIVQAITGVVVSTPQAVALADAKKGVSMFLSEAINVPVLGII